MKRILLNENKDLLNEIIKDLKQYLPIVAEIKKSYENLQLGNFSNDILKEIINRGTLQIEKLFIESLNEQMDKSGISNTILRDNILKGSENLIFEFLEKIRQLKRFKPQTFSRNNYLKLNVISFQNGTFYLSDENKEEILENECRIYIENEKEKELFDKLKNFVGAFDKLNESLNELEFRFSYNQGKGMTGIANTFLMLNENGEYNINPASIKFATNYKENSFKFNS